MAVDEEVLEVLAVGVVLDVPLVRELFPSQVLVDVLSVNEVAPLEAVLTVDVGGESRVDPP